MSLLLCILALVISSTGLIGITGITYEVRTKEIGIRKVNGANIPKVIQWLLKDILTVVTAALIFAAPLAWFLSTGWLKNYVIRISPDIGIFLLAGGSLILIAIITVSWQTWKAASRNPVEALRYE
jgi:putative ABC transport system permease protein